MLGAWLLSFILDDMTLSKRTRAQRSWAGIAIVGVISWGWGFGVMYAEGLEATDIFESDKTNAQQQEAASLMRDFTDGSTFSSIALFTVWGFLDAFAQCWSYWVMSNSSKDPTTLTRYAGFYKTVQCVGAALGSQMNGSGSSHPFPLSRFAQLLINAVLFGICILPSWWIASELDPTVYEPGSSSGGGEGEKEDSSNEQ